MPTTEAFCGHAIRGKGGATKQSLTKAEIEAQGVVGLKGAEKKAWGRWVADVQSRGALAKVLKTGCFGGQSAAEKAVMLFINGKAGKGYTLKMNLGKPAVKWLLLAIKVAPHNAVVADMVRDLLGTQMFTGNLPVMEQWDPLYTGALEILEEIGNVALKPIFDQNNLGASMNDKVLQEHIIYHHLSPKDGGKPSQRLASPAFFDLLKDAYDYTDYTALPERKALVAFLLLCSLVSGEFSDAIDALRASLGNWCSAEVAGVKGFARCLVKLYADYYKLSSPRSQWVLDPLRCLLNGPNAVSMHAITAAISTHFGDGMLQCKNPFSLKEEKRADRNHLLLLNATIIFDAKKTIGALANGPTADRVFAAFKADTSHGLPTSQWNMLVDGGVAFLRSKMLTKVPAMVAAEIQFTMDAYMEGRTPMHWGYDIGRAGDASKLFANFNSGVIVMGEQGNSTTLYNACFSGHFAAVQHFLSNGTNVNEVTRNGATGLLGAAQNNHPDIVGLMLAAGADVDRADIKGVTPLFASVQAGHVEIASLLLAKGASVDKAQSIGTTPLLMAARNGDVEVISILVAKGASVDKAHVNGATPLLAVSQLGFVEAVSLLLTEGASVDKAMHDGTSPLFIAAQHGHVEVVSLLLAKGASVDNVATNGATPLFIAAQTGNVKIATLLLAKDASVDKAMHDGTSPLYIAAQHGHVGVVSLLLAKGASIDKANNKNETSLIVAASFGHAEVVKVLLAAGADHSLKCTQRLTATGWATKKGHAAIATLLQ